MSFGIFKQNMLSYMENQGSIKSYQDFAKKLTTEYDMCIRRGYQTINSVGILKPNVELMEQMVILACSIALQKQKGLHGILNDIGKGVIGYWTGATLNNFPPPIIPAYGSFQNITTTSAMVTNPGKFPEMGTQQPTTNTGIFLDSLIIGMTIHLTTVAGMYVTISMYSGVPVLVAPGYLDWIGYTVPPSQPTVVQVPVVGVVEPIEVDELLKTIPDDNNTIESVTVVTASAGVHILDDDGQDMGPVINSLKSKLPADVPDYDSKADATETVINDTTKSATSIECGGNFTYNDNLSPNVKLRNLTLDPTWPHKLKNQVGLTKEEIVCNLKNLAVNIIEPMKVKYPTLIINSAFRGKPSLVGKVSQHEKGEAVDIQIPGYTPNQYLSVAKWVAETTPFDQIIFEHGKSIWLHISCKRTVNRKSLLTMYKGKYEPGIKSYYV